MKKKINTFYVLNTFCSSGKRIYADTSVKHFLMWRAFMDYINQFATNDNIKQGTDVGAFYGVSNGELSGTRNEPASENLYLIDEIISKLNITVPNEDDYVKLWNLEVVPLCDDIVEITSHESSYYGMFARDEDTCCVGHRFGGGIAIQSECGYLYGEDEEDYCFVQHRREIHGIHYSNRDDEWVCEYDSNVNFGVYNSRGNEGWFCNEDYVYTEDTGNYFYNADVAESNGCWYDEDEYEWYQNNRRGTVSGNNASYHSCHRHILCDLQTTPFRAGFEIEKEDGEAGLISYDDLYEDTSWVKESDGSLDSSTGYELVSPTYPLFTNDMETAINRSTDLQTLINADYSDRCGGHINLSALEYTPEQLFEGVSGFFPLLYAMYEHRLNGGYCEAKKKHQYYGKDKYSAVFIKDRLIEFRIFPAVRSVRNLLWRRDLIRIMCNNINADEIAVVKMMSTPTSPLYKHLRKVFSQEQIIRKIGMFVEYADIYCNKKIDIPKNNIDKLKAKKDKFPDVNDVSDGLGA